MRKATPHYYQPQQTHYYYRHRDVPVVAIPAAPPSLASSTSEATTTTTATTASSLPVPTLGTTSVDDDIQSVFGEDAWLAQFCDRRKKGSWWWLDPLCKCVLCTGGVGLLGYFLFHIILALSLLEETERERVVGLLPPPHIF
jgi:hypothetical protein